MELIRSKILEFKRAQARVRALRFRTVLYLNSGSDHNKCKLRYSALPPKILRISLCKLGLGGIAHALSRNRLHRTYDHINPSSDLPILMSMS